MKKLLIVALILAVMPAFAGVEISGILDLDYFMTTPNDSALEAENFFGIIGSKLNFKVTDLAEGTDALVKMNIADISNGMDSAGAFQLEEIWIAKKGPFGQDALGFKFGKMEVPFNLDVDNGITHSMTNRSGLAYTTGGAAGEIDYTWGLNVNYMIGDGLGTVNLTLFEGIGGTDETDDADLDTGLFQSLALNWDTGKDVDAFGVAGLRIVVGYAMFAGENIPATADNADPGSEMSVGATYALKDMGLCFGLEILIADENRADCMIIALDVDYAQEMFEVGLTYEQAAYDTADTTDSRIAIRANYILDEKNKIRFEYSMMGNADDSDLGGNIISLGYLGVF